TLNNRIERGSVTNKVISIQVKSDLTGRGGDKNGRTFIRPVRRVQESLHYPPLVLVCLLRYLQQFVALQATHCAGENRNGGGERLFFLIAVAADCGREFRRGFWR